MYPLFIAEGIVDALPMHHGLMFAFSFSARVVSPASLPCLFPPFGLLPAFGIFFLYPPSLADEKCRFPFVYCPA